MLKINCLVAFMMFCAAGVAAQEGRFVPPVLGEVRDKAKARIRLQRSGGEEIIVDGGAVMRVDANGKVTAWSKLSCDAQEIETRSNGIYCRGTLVMGDEYTPTPTQ
ncbi:MAG: hypothetical protein QXS54_04480 [Candidatus Methanomethylicaceae archaeon]